jgi:conjugal transfer mating pair stabilization protein TraG
MTGSDKVLPTFSAGRDMSAAVASAYNASEQATSSFMNSVSSTASKSSSITSDAFDSRSLGQQIASSSSQTDAYNRQFGEAFAKKHSDTGLSADHFSALVAGSANAGTKLSEASLGAAISGKLQNDFNVGQDKADSIAADMTRTVNDSRGYQAGLAKSLAMDAQAGTRNVASMGLQNQSLSSLQHSATDAISASETYQQTLSTQQRLGAQANFGTAETGLKLASDGALMERLDHTLDQYGLRGDAQRLASQWKAAGWIADNNQAYAAAGMSLLTGFSSPSYRSLDNQQSRSAEMAGYQLLGDAFHAPKSDFGWNPGKNQRIKNDAPALGTVQSDVEHASLANPRQEAESATHRAKSQINATNGRMASAGKTVEQTHNQNLEGLAQQSNKGFADIRQLKEEHFRASIASAANSTPSAAEWSYNMLGGSIYNTAKEIEAAGAAGSEVVRQFTGSFQEALAKGADYQDAYKFAASQSYPGFEQASKTWADQRVTEVADKLTPSQQAYYRAAMFDAFAGIAIGGDTQGKMGEAKQQLLEEEGETEGNNIAKLLRSAVGQNRGDLIDQIGNFNRVRGRVKD